MAGDEAKVKLQSSRGRTWLNITPKEFLTPDFLNKVGAYLLDSVIYEGKKDLARQGNSPTPRGRPEGLPVTERFWRSFSYEVRGSMISISSDWVTISQLTQGRASFNMDWLRHSESVPRVPFAGRGGTVLIRSTPGKMQDSWVHPGFRRHTFVSRGFEKGKKKYFEMMKARIREVLGKTPPL
jgi:hypothetical protein